MTRDLTLKDPRSLESSTREGVHTTRVRIENCAEDQGYEAKLRV
jgi:hypothetical protein